MFDGKVKIPKYSWLVVIVVVVTATTFLLLPRLTRDDLMLPRTLGSLEMRDEVRGDKARSIINQMHGKGVTPTDNMIGVYTSSTGTATIYLSEYDTPAQAEETSSQMVHGIEKGTSPFSDFKTLTIHGQEVSYCVGFGQAHYFFFVDESVYWLTADFGVAEEAATELIRAISGSFTTV